MAINAAVIVAAQTKSLNGIRIITSQRKSEDDVLRTEAVLQVADSIQASTCGRSRNLNAHTEVYTQLP